MRYRLLLLVIFFVVTFVPALRVRASDTKTVNQGDSMPTIYWDVAASASPCIFGATYPDSANDGIASWWRNNTDGRSNSSLSFGGRTVSALAGTYYFSCRIDSVTDLVTLIVVATGCTGSYDLVNRRATEASTTADLRGRTGHSYKAYGKCFYIDGPNDYPVPVKTEAEFNSFWNIIDAGRLPGVHKIAP